jgi:hypothetical protein
MIDGPIANAEGLVSRFKALLKDMGADSEQIEPHILLLRADAECGPCDGLLTVGHLVTDEEEFGEAHTVLTGNLGFRLPLDEIAPDRLPDLYELMAQMNPEIEVGAFEIDPVEHDLRYRLQLVLSVGPVVSDALLKACLFTSVEFIDQHFSAFAQVVAGDNAPHALGDYLLEMIDGEVVEEDTVAQIANLLREASVRYQRAGDNARIERVKESLQSLA